MNRIILNRCTAVALAGAVCVLAACASSPAGDYAQTLYALSAGLDQAEVAALAYTSSPMADPAVKVKIKSLDATAYNAIHPLVSSASASGVSASEVQAAQDALTALTTYLASPEANIGLVGGN